MLYNNSITYNASGILYTGSLIINVVGIYDPILVNNITIIIDPLDDYSNNTTIGIVTYSVSSIGVMTFETNNAQAEAISGAKVITLNTLSGEVTVQSGDESQAVIQIESLGSSSGSGEVSIQPI